MNNHANNPTPADEPRLPAELLGMSEAMDQLGALDRAAAGASFEQRLASSTLPGLPLGAEDVDSLADADRLAASVSLEDRIFVATRALLNHPGAGVLREDERDAPAPIQIRVRSFHWGLRAAAVLTLAAGASLLYVSNQPSRGPLNIAGRTVTGPEIARQLEGDFENLGNILTVALGGSDTDTASTGGSESASLESIDLDLPSLDFLNTDMEGSI